MEKFISNPNLNSSFKDSTSDITTVHRAAYVGSLKFWDGACQKEDELLQLAACKVGRTPLHYACDGGQDEMVRFSLIEKCPVTVACATPLHFCARGGNLSTMAVLLSEAHVIIDLDVEDSRRQTPSMLNKDEAILDIISKYRESIRIV